MKLGRATIALLLWSVLGADESMAFDCRSATAHVERAICADAKLKALDEKLNAVFTRALAGLGDNPFRIAMIRSQRRWLANRATLAKGWGETPADAVPSLAAATGARVAWLKSGDGLRELRSQRAAYAGDERSPHTGFRSKCFFRDADYLCFGETHRARAQRLCSVRTGWASGHESSRFLVSRLEGATARPVASCSFGYAETAERCSFVPETDSDATGRWNSDLRPSDDLPDTRPIGLWTYDPDQRSAGEEEWMKACLSASDYPPANLIRRVPPPARR